MAIIGKIREKSWLILIVIGGALVTFIFTSQGPGAGGPTEELYGIGTIYGEKVNLEGFNEMVDEEQKGAQRQKDQQLAQQGRQPGSEKADPVDRTRVWQRYVEQLVLEKEYKALGIDVSEAEFDAYLFGESGFEVLPDISQAFSDTTTKLFNPKMLQSRIDEMENSDDPEIQEQWEDSKVYYTELRQKQKYLDIIGQGVYVTNLEAKDEYYGKAEKKNVSFVVKKYAEIKNDEIKVTDKKLKAYFEKHKTEKIYENKFASREVRFADIRIQASAKDTADIYANLNKLKPKFIASTNDSNFVILNSEIPMYVPQIGYKAEGDPTAKQNFTYPAHLDTVFKSANVGDVIGPFEDKGTVKIAKVLGKKDMFLTARHILISAQRADTLAVAKAQKTTDSLMAFITKDNFEEYVTNFSEDPGSKDKGGKYEDFLDGEMVPEFSEFSMEKPIGEIGYVQTDFGFHIMEVLERKPANIPNLGVIQKSIKPSDLTLQSTEDAAYSLLEKLYGKVEGASSDSKKIAAFDTIVKRAGSIARPVNILDNAPTLNEFGSTFAEAEIYKLAFSEEAKVGDIISSPIKDGQRWIVAIVSAIKVKGEANFESVRAIVEREYILDYKYKELKKQMKGKSLAKIAGSGSAGIQTADVIFGETALGQFVRDEPEVIGVLFGALKDGKMTQPIKGKDGVYVVRIERTIKAIPAKDYKTEKDQMVGTIRGGLKSVVTNALLDQADVVDNRRFREIGVRR